MVVHHFLEAFEESAIEPSLEGSSPNGRKEEHKNVGVQKAWILSVLPRWSYWKIVDTLEDVEKVGGRH